MGKSLGNVVEPVPLVEAFGADAVRFFFSSCLSFGAWATAWGWTKQTLLTSS